MKSIYDDNISYISNEIVAIVDNKLDDYPLPHVIYNINPNIEELCDSVNCLLNTRLLSGTLYAWKITHRDLNDKTKRTIGILITNNEEDYKRYNTIGCYKPVKDFPIVIGLEHNIYTKSKYDDMFPQETILIKLDDERLLTRKEFENLMY